MYALQVQNLSKSYPKRKKKALDDLSFEVMPGEFYGLLGPNGAGKSTALNIITQLIPHDSGNVFISGFDINTHPFDTKASVGIVPQEFNVALFETVKDVIFNQAGYYGLTRREVKTRLDYLLERLDLIAQANDNVRTLSGGMKRRLMVARALIHRPKILILDEPTAGVDVELRRGMLDFLREINQEGMTIILTSHYLEEIELLCQRVGIIQQGRLLEQCSVRKLIERADKQVFIIELTDPIMTPINYPSLPLTQLDATTLSVTRKNGQTLEDLFVYLAQQGLKISSVKPQHNRLESLFLTLTQENHPHE